MKKTTITSGEVLAIAIPAIALVVIGALMGWAGTVTSIRYRTLVATAERYEAERTYYERQAIACLDEGLTTMIDKRKEHHRGK